MAGHFHLAPANGKEQRGHQVYVPGIDLNAFIQQHVNDGDASADSGQVDGLRVFIIADIRIGALA
jgi:hypothetical protein